MVFFAILFLIFFFFFRPILEKKRPTRVGRGTRGTKGMRGRGRGGEEKGPEECSLEIKGMVVEKCLTLLMSMNGTVADLRKEIQMLTGKMFQKYVK